MRWSLETYLARWFVIVTADSRKSATLSLKQAPVDALIVSDDLSGRSADEIVACARTGNPAVKVVRTLARPSGLRPLPRDDSVVEKPFDLAQLAKLLGIRDPAKPNGDGPRLVGGNGAR